MALHSQTTGFPEARAYLQKTADLLAGRHGTLYRDLSAVIVQAIEHNADPSYDQSPAKEMVIQSAKEWSHQGRMHKNSMYSDRFANYRQYGCGGLKIAVLVDMTAADIEAMIWTFVNACERL